MIYLVNDFFGGWGLVEFYFCYHCFICLVEIGKLSFLLIQNKYKVLLVLVCVCHIQPHILLLFLKLTNERRCQFTNISSTSQPHVHAYMCNSGHVIFLFYTRAQWPCRVCKVFWFAKFLYLIYIFYTCIVFVYVFWSCQVLWTVYLDFFLFRVVFILFYYFHLPSFRFNKDYRATRFFFSFFFFFSFSGQTSCKLKLNLLLLLFQIVLASFTLCFYS